MTFAGQDRTLLADTATSSVYLVNHHGVKAVLKLLKPPGIRDEANGAVALKYFNGAGAVRLLESDCNAHLLEYVPGDTLKSLVLKGEDKAATEIIGSVLTQLHSAREAAPPPLTPLAVRFESLFRRAAQDPGSVYAKAASVATSLLAGQRNPCVLHGDIHHENILHSPRRGWLSIDPKGLYGETTYDAANALCNPAGMDDYVADKDRLFRNASILARHLRCDQARLLDFTLAHAALSASWSLEDGEDASLALHIARLLLASRC